MEPRDAGQYAMLQERQARIIAANPHLGARITGGKLRNLPPPPAPRPIFTKGRYVSPTLTRLIALVARNADLSVEAICGAGRTAVLTNARFAIANLSEEFCPRLSGRAVDDGTSRGEGLTLWYRERHRDRIELAPEYHALYERCRAELKGSISV